MNEKDIIAYIYQQWIIAKEQRIYRCIAQNKKNIAAKLASCDIFHGTEDLADAIKLFLSPQGVEFCIAANFPSLDTFRMLKRLNIETYGIYIDAGNITLYNPNKAIIVGKTIATIKCDTCEKHQIITMHGATAIINASNWAVVSVKHGKETSITKNATEHAKII